MAKSADCYYYTQRKIMRCKLDGTEKVMLKDLGSFYEDVFDMEVVDGKLYYKRLERFQDIPKDEYVKL